MLINRRFRDFRVETYRQEMSKLHREEECQALIYKQKLQEFQNIKEVLRSLVSSDLYHLIEEYIEVHYNQFYSE